MEFHKDKYWTKEGDLAVLHHLSGRPLMYNKESIEFVISNIERNKDNYFSEEAYLTHINLYKYGLSLFN